MTFSDTIPVSKIEKIGFYWNTKHYTEKKLSTMLKESGGSIIMNASVFLSNGKPCCYLRDNGENKCTPNYHAYGLAWSTPPTDLAMVDMKGCTKQNYIHDCYLIYNGQKIAKPTYGSDRKYACNRTAIGLKNGELAYYVTENNLQPEPLRDLLYTQGWDNAIMLDGGGSTCIWFKNGTGFIGSDPNRYIPFYLVIWLKDDKPIISSTNPYGIPTYTLSKGSSGDGVKWLQYQLNLKGFDCGVIDGIFGNGTKAAVVSFQKANNLVQDGIVGKNTKTKLLE